MSDILNSTHFCCNPFVIRTNLITEHFLSSFAFLRTNFSASLWFLVMGELISMLEFHIGIISFKSVLKKLQYLNYIKNKEFYKTIFYKRTPNKICL